MTAVLRRLRREESGMTLVELLVAATLGIIVITAAFQVLMVGMRGTQRISAGIDTVQIGRLAMENVTRQLRTQICLPTPTGPQPALFYGDATSITFYADLGDETLTPDMRQISFAGGQITERTFANAGTVTNPTFPGYPNTASRTRVLARNVTQDGSTPYLRYYRFSSTDPITPSQQVGVGGAVSDADRPRVVQINVTFVVNPSGPNVDPESRAVMDNRVFVRTSSASDPERSPACL